MPMQRLMSTRLGRPLTRFVLPRPFQRSLSRLFGPDTQPDQATLDALWQLLVHKDGRAMMPYLMAYRAERHRWRERWVKALVQAQIPRLFICGVADPVSGKTMVDCWRRQIRGGDAVELPGIGHWPQLEAPAEVLAVYRQFHRIERGGITGTP
jgi:pimeloyl-ACP methyl ester carboxylesterase